jgi:hypothetical protein
MKAIVYLLLPAALWAGEARYARLGEFDGTVEVQLGAADAWMAAERNLPLPEGAWLRTGPASRVEVEFDDGVVWRLGPDSQGEISDYTRLSTGQRVTLVSLDHGLAWITGQARDKDSVMLAAPGMQVTLTRPARVRVAAREDASLVWVLAGTARFSSPAAELELVQGQMTRVEPDTPARFSLERETLDTDMDRWSGARDEALANPAARLRVIERYGLADLDSAGVWVESAELGSVWKPKAAEEWAPFQKGRWRWYGALGYTWVSDDAWGWLPYHYGRWTHRQGLGWVWSPNLTQVFKPGDVYWMRGAHRAGWGALAPGERFTPAPDTLPQQYCATCTTFAAYEEGAQTIDPAGLAERPKEPLKAMAFTAALPSPAFEASRLDALRPATRAGSTRILPELQGVTYEGDDLPTAPQQEEAESTSAPATAPAPAPVVTPPPEPAEEVPVPVPVAVPYPVAVSNAQGSQKREKSWENQAEWKLFLQVGNDYANPSQQIRDLDEWRRQFPRTQHLAQRTFAYMDAYNRLSPPDPSKILAYSEALVGSDVWTAFGDTFNGHAQATDVLFLATVALTELPHPSTQQVRIGQTAARQLLNMIPHFFVPNLRPGFITADVWKQLQDKMEAAARKALALAS